MSKLGWNVTAYEPDPTHVELFEKNIQLNDAKNIQVNKKAVSNFSGKLVL